MRGPREMTWNAWRCRGLAWELGLWGVDDGQRRLVEMQCPGARPALDGPSTKHSTRWRN